MAWFDPDGSVHVATTNKGAFALREQLSAALDLPIDRIVIHPGVIGGDFGAKGYRPENALELGPILQEAFRQDVCSIIDVPVDYG